MWCCTISLYCKPSSSFTQATSLVNLHHISFSSLLSLMLLYSHMLEIVSVHPIKDSDWHSLKTVSYHKDTRKYSEVVYFVQLSTSYLTTLIVHCSVLLLILIILIRFCVCFKLMWSVLFLLVFCLLMPVFVNFFECQLNKQRKL